MGERKQADVPGLPTREYLEGSLDQALGNAPSPEVRVDRERPEKPDAAPVDREVRPDQLAVHFGGKARGRIGQVAGPYRTGVTAKAQRIRQPEEGAEGEAADPIGGRQVSRSQRADQHVSFGSWRDCPCAHTMLTRQDLGSITFIRVGL